MPTLTRTRRTFAIARGVLIVGAMLTGMAGAAAETPEQRQACMDDAFQFCAEAMPDRERVFSCLAAKRTMISPLCREGMAPFLPPEPVVQQTPPKARTKADAKAKTKAAIKTETKAAAKTNTKTNSKATGAPLSLNPKAP